MNADSFAEMFISVTTIRFVSFCNEMWSSRGKLSLVLPRES